MEFEVCVAVRDLVTISKYYGATRIVDKYPAQIVVKTEGPDRVRIWIGSGNHLPVDYEDVWEQVFPGQRIPLGQSLQLAYDSITAEIRGFQYVQLILRPRAAVLERWIPQPGIEPDSVWAVFSSPTQF